MFQTRYKPEVFGITEDEAEDPDSKLMFFLQHSLKIKEAETIEFQRVHRLGPKRQSSDRPIIARFLRFPDRERVLNNAFMLKGTRYRIMEDHPKEIIEARRKLKPTEHSTDHRWDYDGYLNAYALTCLIYWSRIPQLAGKLFDCQE